MRVDASSAILAVTRKVHMKKSVVYPALKICKPGDVFIVPDDAWKKFKGWLYELHLPFSSTFNYTGNTIIRTITIKERKGK
jgi:hypothetical protein